MAEKWPRLIFIPFKTPESFYTDRDQRRVNGITIDSHRIGRGDCRELPSVTRYVLDVAKAGPRPVRMANGVPEAAVLGDGGKAAVRPPPPRRPPW